MVHATLVSCSDAAPVLLQGYSVRANELDGSNGDIVDLLCALWKQIKRGQRTAVTATLPDASSSSNKVTATGSHAVSA